jgi:glycine cleavage system H protein
MVILLVLATVALCIATELVVRRARSAGRVPETLAATRARPARAARELWLHPGHTWAETHGRGEARIGVSDFATRLLGRVDGIEWPRPGEHIRQGEPFVTLRHGRRSLRLPAPLSGVVVETDPALAADPTRLGRAPLEHGFLARITPLAPATELRNLMHGRSAERWRDAQQMELARWFAPQAGLVAADGGLPAADLADRLSDDDWERLVETFLPEPFRTEDPSSDPDKE